MTGDESEDRTGKDKPTQRDTNTCRPAAYGDLGAGLSRTRPSRDEGAGGLYDGNSS